MQEKIARHVQFPLYTPKIVIQFPQASVVIYDTRERSMIPCPGWRQETYYALREIIRVFTRSRGYLHGQL